ncbi:hypothetical protein CCA_00837 [Chlamydia caviae GPIC]|uniref:Uncharacterized protein n=1 Tax=Chlamydia caviae (strain ATCC VR-813 / DSM 19441 / 03DC25 / GPIC) TaxID=227941 RepID=Q821U8_CHLCV|nr:hypothetical protein CCA_00837 [Chlamydia caviae GPIC]
MNRTQLVLFRRHKMLSGHSVNHPCRIVFFLLKRNKKHHLKVLTFSTIKHNFLLN